MGRVCLPDPRLVLRPARPGPCQEANGKTVDRWSGTGCPDADPGKHVPLILDKDAKAGQWKGGGLFGSRRWSSAALKVRPARLQRPHVRVSGCLRAGA